MKKQNSFEEQLREQIGDTEWKPSDNLWSRIEQGMDAADSFEPALRNKLDAFSQEPRKEVWEKIESELPEPPKRRGLFWFSTVAVMLLITFSAGYWFRDHTTDTGMMAENKVATAQNNTTNIPSTIIAPESGVDAKDVAAQSAESANNNPAPSSQSIAQSNIASGSNPQKISETNKLASPTSKVNQNNKNTAPAVNENPTAVNNTKSASVGKSKSNSAKQKQSVIAVNSIPGNQNTNQIIPPVNGNNSGLAASGSSENKGIPSGKSTSESDVPATGSQTGVDNNQENKPKTQAPIVLESVNINPQPKDSFSQEQIVRGSTYLAPDEEFSRFSISAMAGVHMSFMKLLMPAQNDYNMEQCLALRKDLESPALDFSGSLQLNYMVGKNTYITTGIGIISIKQNVEFAVAPAVNATPGRVQPVNRYIHPGDTITSGTGNTYENKYSFTEIPLYVGYKFPSESKMHFEVMGGISYARLNLVNAVMPDPSGVGMLMCDSKSDFPGFKDVFFATLIPGATFMLNSSTDLGLMAPLKMSVNNMVDNSKWMGQKPAAAGLSIMIRKRF